MRAKCTKVSWYLFAALGSMSAHADSVPGFGSASYYYYSTDFSPIEISFAEIAYDNGTPANYRIGYTDPTTGKFVEGKPIAVVTLPRAFVNALSPYSSAGTGNVHEDFVKDVLPDKVVGHSLTITMTYPDGLPFSLVYETWPRHKPLSIVDAGDKESEIRALTLRANVDAYSSGRSRESELFKVPKILEYVGEYQGFGKYKYKVGTLEVYFADDIDEIRRIECGQAGNPLLFCEYWFPLNEHFIVALKFIDFRAHGGRAFARERIRAFKRAICPTFRCDKRALKAAEIQGD